MQIFISLNYVRKLIQEIIQISTDYYRLLLKVIMVSLVTKIVINVRMFSRKLPVIFSDFNQTLLLWQDFSKIPNYKVSRKNPCSENGFVPCRLTDGLT